MVKATPPHPSDSEVACDIAGFSWCTVNNKFGHDVDGGKHDVENIRVKPYFLVPEREQDLRLVFFIDNHADSVVQEVGLAIANAYSKVGMVVLSAYGAQSGSSSTGSFA